MTDVKPIILYVNNIEYSLQMGLLPTHIARYGLPCTNMGTTKEVQRTRENMFAPYFESALSLLQNVCLSHNH